MLAIQIDDKGWNVLLADKKKDATKRKTVPSLVVLDSPDDGELYETGDAADFAGKQVQGTKPPRTQGEKEKSQEAHRS